MKANSFFLSALCIHNFDSSLVTIFSEPPGLYLLDSDDPILKLPIYQLAHLPNSNHPCHQWWGFSAFFSGKRFFSWCGKSGRASKGI